MHLRLTGDPIEYHYYMEVFMEVEEKRAKDTRGRLTRLSTQLGKQRIWSTIQQPSAKGYEDAMGLLEGRYGDLLKIMRSYWREI